MPLYFSNSFSTSTCLCTVLCTTLAVSSLLAKFSSFSLALKLPAANVLNYGVVIYLSWVWSAIFLPISLIFLL